MYVIRKGETPASTTDWTTKLAAIHIDATVTMYINPTTQFQALLFIPPREWQYPISNFTNLQNLPTDDPHKKSRAFVT